MASMKDIKRRKSSIQSTQQITKAMKLVSTVKLQKAKIHAEATNPYFNHMFQTVTSILARSENISHPYLKRGASDRKAVVVITSNRGLAGGYNSNVTKMVKAAGFSPEETDIYAIGNKGRDYFRHRGYTIKKEYSYVMDSPEYGDATEVCKEVLRSFADGEIGEIYLAYTHFKNTVVHEPTLLKLLPVEFNQEDLRTMDDKVLMNFEPNEENSEIHHQI